MSAALTFAVNCQRYGVETPQCTRSALEYWAAYTKARNQSMYETYYAPLLAQLRGTPAQPTTAAAAEPGASFATESLLASFTEWLRDVNQITRTRSRTLRI